MESVNCSENVISEAGETPSDNNNNALLTILNGIEEAVYVIDPADNTMLFANAVAKALFGQDMVGRNCYRVLHNQDAPCEFCNHSEILENAREKASVREIKNRRNGRWYRCSEKAIEWSDGRRVRFGMAVDIQETRRKERELHESERRQRA